MRDPLRSLRSYFQAALLGNFSQAETEYKCFDAYAVGSSNVCTCVSPYRAWGCISRPPCWGTSPRNTWNRGVLTHVQWDLSMLAHAWVLTEHEVIFPGLLVGELLPGAHRIQVFLRMRAQWDLSKFVLHESLHVLSMRSNFEASLLGNFSQAETEFKCFDACAEGSFYVRVCRSSFWAWGHISRPLLLGNFSQAETEYKCFDACTEGSFFAIAYMSPYRAWGNFPGLLVGELLPGTDSVILFWCMLTAQ